MFLLEAGFFWESDCLAYVSLARRDERARRVNFAAVPQSNPPARRGDKLDATGKRLSPLAKSVVAWATQHFEDGGQMLDFFVEHDFLATIDMASQGSIRAAGGLPVTGAEGGTSGQAECSVFAAGRKPRQPATAIR